MIQFPIFFSRQTIFKPFSMLQKSIFLFFPPHHNLGQHFLLKAGAFSVPKCEPDLNMLTMCLKGMRGNLDKWLPDDLSSPLLPRLWSNTLCLLLFFCSEKVWGFFGVVFSFSSPQMSTWKERNLTKEFLIINLQMEIVDFVATAFLVSFSFSLSRAR